MPKRQSTQKKPTPEMQGDDSWVIVRPPTVKQAREYQKKMRDVQQQLDAVQTAGGDLAKENELEDDLNLIGMRAFSTFFVEWNWVDDDEKPLDQPAENPDVFEDCTATEIKYLGNIMADMMGNEDEKKD